MVHLCVSNLVDADVAGCRYQVSLGATPCCDSGSWARSRFVQVRTSFLALSFLLSIFFSPGVHWLQDPRSRVYNFSPWLQQVPKVPSFDFNRVDGFIKSSEDRVSISPHALGSNELTLQLSGSIGCGSESEMPIWRINIFSDGIALSDILPFVRVSVCGSVLSVSRF